MKATERQRRRARKLRRRQVRRSVVEIRASVKESGRGKKLAGEEASKDTVLTAVPFAIAAAGCMGGER
jgi:hypothetical protein